MRVEPRQPRERLEFDVIQIVLVTEMTANVTMLLPMIVTGFAALLVPTLFGDMAILDSLKERLVAGSTRTAESGTSLAG